MFLVKNVFDPDDGLARWILKLAMVRNDLFYVHKRLQIDESQPFHKGESFYFFRLGISHLREAIKLIYLFRDEDSVVDFVKQLNLSNQQIFKRINELNNEFNSPDSIVSNTLSPIRNHSYHYYEMDKKGKRDKKYEHKFIDELKAMGDLSTRFIAHGSKRREVDYLFADDITFHLLFGLNIDEDEFRESVSELSNLMSDFIAFSDDSVGHYLILKRSSMTKVITK